MSKPPKHHRRLVWKITQTALSVSKKVSGLTVGLISGTDLTNMCIIASCTHDQNLALRGYPPCWYSHGRGPRHTGLDIHRLASFQDDAT